MRINLMGCLLCLLMYSCGIAQSSFDLSNLLELNIVKSDSVVKINHIKTVFQYDVDASHNMKLYQVKKYDQNGYLIENVQHYSSESNGTLTVKYRKRGNNIFIADASVDRMSIVNATGYTPLAGFKIYLDALNSSRKILTIRSTYTFNKGRSLEIETLVDGKLRDIVLDSTLFYEPVDEMNEQILKGDTSILGDTLVVSITEEKGGAEKQVGNRFYVHAMTRPIKVELIKYWRDSITFFSGHVWQYDKLNRRIYFGKYQGPPYLLFVSEKTVYNDTTGGKIIYEDAFPSDGKTDKISKYNATGQLVEYIKYSNLNANTNLYKYFYDKRNIIKEEQYFFNGVYRGGKVYKYQFN